MLRLPLEGVSRVANRGRRAGRVGLLHHVGYLVGEQAAAGRGVRLEAAGAHHDVRPERVGVRSDRLGRAGGLGIGVYPDVAEVVTEAGLHLGSDG